MGDEYMPVKSNNDFVLSDVTCKMDNFPITVTYKNDYNKPIPKEDTTSDGFFRYPKRP